MALTEKVNHATQLTSLQDIIHPLRQCAATAKKLSLEMGGNAPFIVFDSADLDVAVPGCMASKFRNAGQTCVSANRVLVQSGIHDEFVAKLAKAMEGQIVVGNGKEANVTQVRKSRDPKKETNCHLHPFNKIHF